MDMIGVIIFILNCSKFIVKLLCKAPLLKLSFLSKKLASEKFSLT